LVLPAGVDQAGIVSRRERHDTALREYRRVCPDPPADQLAASRDVNRMVAAAINAARVLARAGCVKGAGSLLPTDDGVASLSSAPWGRHGKGYAREKVARDMGAADAATFGTRSAIEDFCYS